jgi:hypothetical protein
MCHTLTISLLAFCRTLYENKYGYELIDKCHVLSTVIYFLSKGMRDMKFNDKIEVYKSFK